MPDTLEALARDPNQFDALHLLGWLCQNRNQPADALGYLSRAARLRPDHPALCINTCNALQALQRFPESETLCRRILAAHPDHADVLNCLGIALAEQGRLDEAIAAYRAVLARKPDHAPAYFNMAKPLAISGRLEEAAAAFRAALAHAPPDTPADRIADILSRLGEVFVELDRPEDALALLRDNSDRCPGHPSLLWNRSLLLLQLGDYVAGWREYEGRWFVRDHDAPRSDATVPDLAEIAGKRVLLTSEQGRGDMIQFIRYAPLLAERGATVSLSTYDDLVPLVTGMAGVARVIGEDQYEPAYDIVTPVMSLPLAFGTTTESIPARVPYLRADPDRVARWRSRFGGDSAPRVGLCWYSTNPGPRRATQLETLRPLLGCSTVTFHAIQKQILPTDEAIMRREGRPRDHRAELSDFAETAALIEALDLVIAIDTAVAHLAGALGKPVWIMLPYVAEWRWLRHRDDSPWYPTARLFRQPAPGDWDGLAEQIAKALTLRFPPLASR